MIKKLIYDLIDRTQIITPPLVFRAVASCPRPNETRAIRGDCSRLQIGIRFICVQHTVYRCRTTASRNAYISRILAEICSNKASERPTAVVKRLRNRF